MIHSSNSSARIKMQAAINTIQTYARKDNSENAKRLPAIKRLNERLLEISEEILDIVKPLSDIYQANKKLDSGSDDFEFSTSVTTYDKEGSIISVSAVGYEFLEYLASEGSLYSDHDDTWRRYHRNFNTCEILHSIEQHGDSEFFLGRKADEDDLLKISYINLYLNVAHQYIESFRPDMSGLSNAFTKIIARISESNITNKTCDTILEVHIESEEDYNIYQNETIVNSFNSISVSNECKFLLDKLESGNEYPLDKNSTNCFLWITFKEVRKYECPV